MNQEVTREVMLYDNLSLEIRNAHNDNARQIADIRYFISEKVDLLIVSPNTSEALVPVIEEAHNAGIRIIIADRKVFTDCYDSFVGANNYQIGQAVGSYVSSILPKGGRVVEITGHMASSPAMERHHGFMSALSGNQDIEVLTSCDGQWLKDPAFDNMLSILRKYDNINVVFAHNDEMALAAYNAAKSLGREGGIKFIGIDGLPGKYNGIGLVADDILTATFLYPTGAEEIVKAAVEILAGHVVPRDISLNTAVVDRTNVRVMELQGEYISKQDSKIGLLSERIGNYSHSYTRQRNLLVTSLILLGIVLVAVVFLFIILRSKISLSRKLEEQRDRLMEMSRQMEEVTQSKLRFFTNISHEFRTPLTLIADPLKRLKSIDVSEEERQYLIGLMDKNVNILLRLVNQILEFRRYENGKAGLMLSEVDLRERIGVWNESFKSLFAKKSIRFETEIADGRYDVTLDANKVEQLYYNLIHNAFKYTPESGEVKVMLFSDDDGIRLEVFNTGSYIPPESRDKIFDRFFQLSDHSSMGSGIGLAVVHAYVEMHNGSIDVESEMDDGTRFKVWLPRGIEDTEEHSETESPDTLKDMRECDSMPTMLIVDDNEDVRSYIRNIFCASFILFEAGDGHEGLQMAFTHMPDVILLDVMMPRMNGIECCKTLKRDIRTCHIPVIMLTACSEDIHRKKGYDSGADSYIMKPFASDVLSSRVQNLLDSRRKLYGANITAVQDDAAEQILTKNLNEAEQLDKEFIEALTGYIMENIEDSELDVASLGNHMTLSRMQLYRKVKALTGYSPNEFVRFVRLKRAAQLLLTSHKNVSEISYETGFSSPSYFAKCFKAFYGKSPGEYKKDKS